ncbi:MAG: hypothetical protein KatS3mg102_1430 [Planctomycetota bacterium]|nr:MAG: hypothetical protein KatS3mg102_1430 [Planctomycetota bacterium]
MSSSAQPLPLAIAPASRFACQRCGCCCKGLRQGRALEPEDIARLAAHDWAAEHPRLRAGWRLEPQSPGAPARLRLVEGGRCVFLDDDDLCLVQRRLGYEAKPLRCRAFPFRFARVGEELRLSISAECRGWWRSYATGPQVVETPELRAMARRLPGTVLVGERFALLAGGGAGQAELGREQLLALLDDLAGAARADEPLERLPWRFAWACRRALGGQLPPSPWQLPGPPESSFYAVLHVLGEALGPLAQRLGLGLIASAFAELRRWQLWERAARALAEQAACFVRQVLAQQVHELRPLVLGPVVAGAGMCLYLAMGSAVGAWRRAALGRGGAAASGDDANAAAAQAARLLRARPALAQFAAHALALERLVLDAPPPAAPRQPAAGAAPEGGASGPAAS